MVARDRGNPPQSSTGLVQLYVGEEHGQTTLRFQNSTYRIGIQENAQTGSDVVQVRRNLLRESSEQAGLHFDFETHKGANVVFAHHVKLTAEITTPCTVPWTTQGTI